MRICYRRRAQLDLENIYEYIRNFNPNAAKEVVARIRSAIDRLGTFPHMGHVGRASGTFEWVVVGSPYIVVYEIDETAEQVEIIAVLHGAQRKTR